MRLPHLPFLVQTPLFCFFGGGVFIKVCVAMPPKRNNRRFTHMTEKEIDTLMNLPLACFRSDGVLAVQAKKKAQAREEADREKEILCAREAAANRVKQDAREAR